MANKLFQNNCQYFTNNLHKNQNSFGIYIQCQINEHSVCYTAKNVQVATRLLTSCCYQQPISGCVRMACDMQLVDDKSVASQQTCSKLIVTGSKSANEKLILTDLLQLDENDKFVTIC